MKRKIIITFAISLLLLLVISVVTNASIQTKKQQILTEQQTQQKASIQTKNQQVLTEQQKHIKMQVDDSVNQGRMDIIKTFEINQSQYVQIDAIKDLPEFSIGKGFIKDKKKVQSILQEVITPNLDEVPINSMLPLILISKDGNEVIFGYKLADGNNVITVNKYQDDKWVRGNKKIQKGEVPRSLDSMKNSK